MSCASSALECGPPSAAPPPPSASPPSLAASPSASLSPALAAKWRSCLHECAHVLAGVLLLKRTSRALVFSGGGGVADIGGTSAVPQCEGEAIAAAVGEIAGLLSAKHPPPEVPEVAGVEGGGMLPCVDVERPEAAARIVAAMDSKESLSDEEAVARWCILGCETRPYRWRRRYEWVVDRSHEFVSSHEREIVGLARKLFVWGSLTLPFDSAERN